MQKSDEKLKIEEYQYLLGSMDELTEKMPEVVCDYFDSNKYLFSVYFEAFNSIRSFCVLLGNGVNITQSCAVLRMAIEETAIIRILEKYPQLIDSYVEHFKFRFSIMHEKNQRDKIIEHYENKIDKRSRALDYLDYGWIEEVSKDYGFHSLVKIAGMDDEEYKIYPWIDTLNMWIHGTLHFSNLASGNDLDGPTKYAHALIDIAATLLDMICCEFHNDTKFDFIIDGYDYYHSFRGYFEKASKK